MINRRDAKLDSLLGKIVRITFENGQTKTGVLEWDMFYKGKPSNSYSLYVFGYGYFFFKKTHVARVKEWEETRQKELA